MAPNSDGPTRSSRVEDHLDPLIRPSDPPPSTLAAHLVSNLSSTRRPSKQDDQEDIKRLLFEVSKLSDSADSSTTAASNIDYHHKLIYVVAKIIFEGLISDNPFANEKQLLQQALEGLDVLIATVREDPPVLLHVSDIYGQHGGNAVPLWLWLFPRILALLGRSRCELLQDKISQFFSTTFAIAARSLQLWVYCSQWFYYLKHDLNACLIHLHDSIPTAPGSKISGLSLPLASFREDMEMSDHPGHIPEDYTFFLPDATTIFNHCSHLLELMMEGLSSPAHSDQTMLFFENNLSWMLDRLLELAELEAILKSDMDLDPNSEPLFSYVRSVYEAISRSESLSSDMSKKAYIILLQLYARFLALPAALSDITRQEVSCRIFLNIALACRRYESVSHEAKVTLLPLLSEGSNIRSHIRNLTSDFEQVIAILDQCCVGAPPADGLTIVHSDSIQDKSLIPHLERLGIKFDTHDGSHHDRPSKRLRLDIDSAFLSEISERLYMLLGSQKASDLDGLAQVAVACFTELSDQDRCQAMRYLALIPCAGAGTLQVIRDNDGEIQDAKCHMCSGGEGSYTGNKSYDRAIPEAIAALKNLVASPDFEQTRRPRILAMIALRAFAIHFDEEDFLDLEISSLGQWCLKSLRSSLRELRIAAGRTVPAFLRMVTNPEISHRNNIIVLDFLRELSDQCPLHLTETCVLAWGQIGRFARDRELNLVLLRLVAYLGHTNQVISAVAFEEILRIAETQDTSVGQLLGPFWRSIAPTAVNDLQSRPQTTQLLADMLRITVPDLLIMTQTYTIPWLVLSKRKEIILRIAQARKDDDPWQTCFQSSSNLRSIMALLLVQNVPDLEKFVMDSLRYVSKQFDKLDLQSLCKLEPLGIALELLKIAGEEDESKKPKARHALQILANNASTGSGDAGYSKRGQSLGPFLEQHALGIMSDLSYLLNDSRQSGTEKRRSLKGIDELLKLGKSHIRAALPQICTSLQSALSVEETRSTAFDAWTTMMRSLDDEDIGSLLETTFSTIVLYWKVFDKKTQIHAMDLIKYLLSKRLDLVRSTIDTLPSLASIAELEPYDADLRGLKSEVDVRQQYQIYARRLAHEHASVVIQALTELAKFLRRNQAFLQASAISEQPDSVVGDLLRAILDACVRFNGSSTQITLLSAECAGLIGCLDSNRVEAVRERREIVVVSNFEDTADTTDFVLFVLEEVLVKAFLSATDPKAQGFLSYAMQELLEKCDFKDACSKRRWPGDGSTSDAVYQKWLRLPESVQATLTPFMKSRYVLTEMVVAKTEYPIFQPHKKYSVWVKAFTLHLLRQPHNVRASIIFAPLCRVIRIEDSSVASALLPFVALHTILSGTDEEREGVTQELLSILKCPMPEDSHSEQNNLKLCSEAAFRILDYASLWRQEKQSSLSQAKGYDSRWSDELPPSETSIDRVSTLLASIPADVLSRRAVECKSYARALFHWEQHIRQVKETSPTPSDTTPLLERLQDIYTQIDEPDGIEGISAQFQVLDIDQQILAHRKAGRWTAAQSWYEIKLADDPGNADLLVNLLYCLKESGQHDVLLNYVEGKPQNDISVSRTLPFAVEASWAIGRWDILKKYLNLTPNPIAGDFNLGVGQALLALYEKNKTSFDETIRLLREHLAASLSVDNTSSLRTCHETMLKFHVLTELEMISPPYNETQLPRQQILESFGQRLEAIGAYLNDKQYLLGIRRAAMQLTSPTFNSGDIASLWLTSARLARKEHSTHQAFNAVLHASKLGDESAKIEHARLLWKEGHHRKAIQSLQGAIDSNSFIMHNRGLGEDATNLTATEASKEQNRLTARAHLLLAKWLDSAGQTQSSALRIQYQQAARMHQAWEKGHYYLGRHYNKLLESEKNLAPEQQTQSYLIGETAKLVIENYLRALTYGTKYIYQTLPRILTLWLDLGIQVNQPLDPKFGTKEFTQKMMAHRKEQLNSLHSRFSKYIQKMPAYAFYTALPQIMSRITHPNAEVYKYLQQIIVKVVSTHPQQALWSLLAVSTSTQPDRRNRGAMILSTLRNAPKKADVGGYDLRTLIKSGEKLTGQLLMVCTAGDFTGNRTITASLTRDLNFNPKSCTPNPLAVPIESGLTATLPTLTTDKGIRTHKAFSRDVVTISQFLDPVLILSSLQKPRKLSARGSDGRIYGLMCKPKDDLRKDQRLMEFNSMINRFLKRDAESSRRQLYIRTYAVTPLNEECGIIEWVDGLKTLRDILLNLYKARGIVPNYAEIKAHLDEACKSDANLPLFTDKMLKTFPPVFYSWFVQQFPDPAAWFVARLTYTRSCAVMSMVGTILGLGDRHGENILFEDRTGGTFHVDFNCLFDKGLTFAQPERVPFRLTHNMVDAMGVYGYEGPFRTSGELTLRLLRAGEETLMTILEAFVYDPTLDLLKKSSKRRERGNVIADPTGMGLGLAAPDSPHGVLESIRRKVRGLLPGESVPLGVEGQVDELIQMAVNPKNLAAMYIGWCAFF